MPWKPMAYALLCVVVPVAWGLVVYWMSGLIERRVLRRAHPPLGEAASGDVHETLPHETLPLEYHI